MLADLCRLKEVKISTNYYALTIKVYDIEDYNYLKELSRRKDKLTDIFYNGLKVGLTSEEAKEAVEDFVKARPEYLEAYKEIY